jgi:hypothetical protein
MPCSYLSTFWVTGSATSAGHHDGVTTARVGFIQPETAHMSLTHVWVLFFGPLQAPAAQKQEAPARPASPFANLFGGSQTIQVG